MPENELKKLEKEIRHPLKLAEQYWDTLGPGLVTGAADDDPSGIATYTQAGARFGTQLLWLAPFTFPLMAIVQEMCARIGIVTGQGLAANIRAHYSRKVLYLCTLLLFIANTINIGANLGAMSAAFRLVVPSLPAPFLLLFFTVVSLALQIFMPYARYSKYLKYLALALFAYVISALMSNIEWGTYLRGALVPSWNFSREYLILFCAVLGTTISPYLFFWQTSQEVEEKILKGQTTIQERREQVHPKDMRKMRVDVWSGMLFSNLIMFFIMVTGAAVIAGKAGITTINTSAEAALALQPLGAPAFLLFAVGILGTGLLSIPVLAGSTSYAISESFGWKHGLYYKLHQAYLFYGVIGVSMVFGLLLNAIGIHPMHALIFAAVANGCIAPVILFFIIRMSGNRHIMGEHANPRIISFFGWALLIVMAVSGIVAILQYV